jgi:hypothetical protein
MFKNRGETLPCRRGICKAEIVGAFGRRGWVYLLVGNFPVVSAAGKQTFKAAALTVFKQQSIMSG